MKWIYAALSDALAVAPVHLVIEPRIFVTRGDTSLASVMPSEDSSSKSEDNEKGDFDPLQSPLRVESGRPDIDSLLRSEIAAGSGSRVSVDGKHCFYLFCFYLGLFVRLTMYSLYSCWSRFVGCSCA